MNKLIGAIFIAAILSMLVALVAKNKTIGYLKGVIIAFVLNIVFILLQIPFDCITGSLICLVIFMFLKPKEKATIKQ